MLIYSSHPWNFLFIIKALQCSSTNPLFLIFFERNAVELASKLAKSSETWLARELSRPISSALWRSHGSTPIFFDSSAVHVVRNDRRTFKTNSTCEAPYQSLPKMCKFQKCSVTSKIIQNRKYTQIYSTIFHNFKRAPFISLHIQVAVAECSNAMRCGHRCPRLNTERLSFVDAFAQVDGALNFNKYD